MYFAVASPWMSLGLCLAASCCGGPPINIALKPEEFLIIYEGSENVIQKPFSLSFSPTPSMQATQVKVETGFFKVAYSCCVISISSLFLSFRPPSRATVQLWPHFLCLFRPSAHTPADSTPAQVMHLYCVSSAQSILLFFFSFLNSGSVKMSADQSASEMIKTHGSSFC